MARRAVLFLVLVSLLAGSTAAAAKDPRDPQKRIDAQDQAWARSIRIQRKDLGAGDWRVEQTNEDDSNAPAGCKNPNLSDLVLTGEAKNPDFSRNGSFVGSGAQVWSSERHAAASWKRATRFPLSRCLSDALKQGFAQAGPGVKLTVFSSGSIRIGRLAPRQLTYGMRFRLQGPALTLVGRLGFYAFSRGRADGILMVMSFGPPATPVAESFERRLARLVAQRLSKK